MTIKHLTMSTVVAALVSTAAFAATGGGKLTYAGGSGSSVSTYTVAKEKLDFADLNVTNQFGVTSKLQYKTGTIPNGSISKPAITIKLTGGIFAGTTWSDINISDAVTGATIGTYKAGAGTSELAIEPFATGSVTSGEDLNITSAAGDIQLSKGSSSVSMEVVIGYSTDPSTADSGSATIIDSKQEYTAAVTTPFGYKIDASKSFYSLLDGTLATATNETATITATQAADIDDRIGNTTATLTIFSDVNTSAFITAYDAIFDSVASITESLNDNNTTATAAAASTLISTDTITAKYSIPNDKEIKVTNFSANLTHSAASIGTAAKLFTDGTSIGKWTIYGYTAQIPNVVSNSTIDCALKFTNRSTIASEIYFTLIDQDGTVVSLSSAADGLSNVAKDGTTTYNASELLAKVTETNFDKTGSFSVEVAIPTTPNSVYGMASFNNSDIGKFYALPVYNSSTMSY